MYQIKGLDVEFIGEAPTDKLHKEQVLKGKVQLVYARAYKDCIRMYQLLKIKMAGEFTEPVGYPNLL